MKTYLYSVKLFFTTIAFLSWIPVPHRITMDKALHKMGIFFPIAGMILGGLAALVLTVSTYFFPYPVSIALTLLAYGWITGMFHEDALADVADGMGGYDSKKILAIMRDSCIGTYGAFTLISTYVLRFAALSSIDPKVLVVNLIAYAAVSRMAGVVFLTLTQPKDIPPESLSRTVPFSNQWLLCGLGLLISIAIIFVLSPSNTVFIPIVMLATPVVSRWYFLKRIGFITGDCAGFVIHVTETILHVFATISL